MQSALMALQTVSVLRAQRDFISIMPKMLIEQPTKKSISNKWWSGWPIKRNAISLMLTSHGLTLKRMKVVLMEGRKIFWMMHQSIMSQLHSLWDILSQDAQHTPTFPSLLLLTTLVPPISSNNLKLPSQSSRLTIICLTTKHPHLSWCFQVHLNQPSTHLKSPKLSPKMLSSHGDMPRMQQRSMELEI